MLGITIEGVNVPWPVIVMIISIIGVGIVIAKRDGGAGEDIPTFFAIIAATIISAVSWLTWW